jgi:RimJ/RimL family protein N-acetyltransferase
MTDPTPSLAMPIRSERLELRLFETDDVDDRYAYQRLPEVARYLFRPPHSRERCAELIAEGGGSQPSWTTDGDMVSLAVTRRDAPGVVGEIMLKLDDARAQQMEIGWVFHPAHGGRGYATEAARAAAAAAFDQLGAHRLFARLDTGNLASARLCERLGMRREGHLVENDLDPDDRWASEYVYATLEDDLRR